MRSRILFVAVGFSLVISVSGQDPNMDLFSAKPITQTTRFGISPFYGYRFGGEIEDDDAGLRYSFEHAAAYGLILGYAPMNYYARFELLWSRQDSSVDFQGNSGLGKVDLTIDVIQVGGEVEYGGERLRGYVSGHLGATHFAAGDHGDDTKFSLGIGGGVKTYLTKNVYLRADIRGFCTVTEGEGSFIYANGVTIASFSGSTLWQGQVSAGVGVTF